MVLIALAIVFIGLGAASLGGSSDGGSGDENTAAEQTESSAPATTSAPRAGTCHFQACSHDATRFGRYHHYVASLGNCDDHDFQLRERRRHVECQRSSSQQQHRLRSGSRHRRGIDGSRLERRGDG